MFKAIQDWILEQRLNRAIQKHDLTTLWEIAREHEQHAVAAIAALKEIGGDQAVEQIGYIGYQHEQHAVAAITALQEIGEDQAVEQIGYIGYQHEQHAVAAITALQEIGEDQAVEQIGDIGYQHEQHAVVAIAALKKIGGDQAVGKIGDIGCQHDQPAVVAIAALQEIGGDQAVERIGEIGVEYATGPIGLKAFEALIALGEETVHNGAPLSEVFTSAAVNVRNALLRDEATLKDLFDNAARQGMAANEVKAQMTVLFRRSAALLPPTEMSEVSLFRDSLRGMILHGPGQP